MVQYQVSNQYGDHVECDHWVEAKRVANDWRDKGDTVEVKEI